MVAERAGVSRGTVDRVLNQRPHVRAEQYEKVVRAMKELKYMPADESKALALGLTTQEELSCRLGVVLPNWRGHFKREILSGIRDAGEILAGYGVEIVIEECETNLTDEIIERMDSLQQQEIAGIAMCAKDDGRIARKIDAFYNEGIPTVTFNSDIADSRRLCFVGQDLQQSGRIAGDLMVKCLRPGERILIAVGNSEFSGHRQRMQGFCQRIFESDFKDEDIEVIETYNDYTLTYQRVKEALERIPNLKGIYMANESVAGCAEAIRDTGRKGEIRLISHDLTDETRRLLQMKELDFTIAQNIYQQGYQPLLILRNYIQLNIEPKAAAGQSAIEIMCAENL